MIHMFFKQLIDHHEDDAVLFSALNCAEDQIHSAFNDSMDQQGTNDTCPVAQETRRDHYADL